MTIGEQLEQEAFAGIPKIHKELKNLNEDRVTKRDFFIGVVLHAVLTTQSNYYDDRTHSLDSRSAILIADTLMKELEKEKEKED